MPSTSVRDVYNMLRTHQPLDMTSVLHENATNSKDVLVSAFLVDALPTTLEQFKKVQTDEYYRVKVLVCAVDKVDGNDYGWSKAPYDSKKTLSRADQKQLYSLDTGGETAGQTRFWSYKKVSNNMNKGERQEERVNDIDTNFVIPDNPTLSFFIRETNYDDRFFDMSALGQDAAVAQLDPYTPVMLHISGSNSDQTVAGNGIKLRRIVAVGKHAISTFSSYLPTSKKAFYDAQNAAASVLPLKKVLYRPTQALVRVALDKNAFVEDIGDWIQILEAGMDIIPALGKKLVIDKAILLSTMNSADIKRATRMLTVALGSGAVSAVVLESNERKNVTEAVIQHLIIDVNQLLWLNKLESSRQHDIENKQKAVLPDHAELRMVFGTSLAQKLRKERDMNDAAATFSNEDSRKVLQWYNPSHKVLFVDENGQEALYNVVMEMDLVPKIIAGSREKSIKYFMMDDCDGFHHQISFFRVQNVTYDEECGFGNSPDSSLLITWQVRPGQKSEQGMQQTSTRKRVLVTADDLDNIAAGAFDTSVPLLQRDSDRVNSD